MIYRMRKIVSHSEEIPLPTCMYRLKKVNSEDDTTNSNDSEPDLRIKEQQMSNKKMALLEKRQDHLLEQLDILHQRITSLSLLCKSEPSSTSTQRASKPKIAVPADVIINTSAAHLPYFLVILAKGHLKDKLSVTYHIHSSVPATSVEKIKEFVKLLNCKPLNNSVEVKLIFKEVSANTELKWVTTGVPIVGEVNILRYLALLFPQAIVYNESLLEDSLLDDCYLLQRSASTEVVDACLQRLFASYKGDWIVGKEFSIVDMAAISAIKQIEGRVPKLFRFTPKPWFEKANQLFN